MCKQILIIRVIPLYMIFFLFFDFIELPLLPHDLRWRMISTTNVCEWLETEMDLMGMDLVTSHWHYFFSMAKPIDLSY